MTRTIEFKPDVTVRVEATEDEINVYVNGDQLLVSPHESYLETRYPGLTAAVEELSKPLAEDEAWLDGERFAVSLRADGYIWLDRSWGPDGWPRVLAIAERLLAEREPKLEAKWEEGQVRVEVAGRWYDNYSHESCTHEALDAEHPGAWEKHVLPCILKNRPLADNEYRQDDGRMIWQFEARVGVVSGMPQARVRYVTDDGSFGSWHSRDRRDLLADPVWVAAFDYLDRTFPAQAEHTAAKPKKPSERLIEIFKSRGYDKRAPGNEVQDVLSAVGEMLDEEFERFASIADAIERGGR